MSSLSGGPASCPKACDVCEGSAKHQLAAWFACKHCDAWIEDLDDEEEW